MSDGLGYVCGLAWAGILLAVGFAAGKWNERRHRRELKAAESELSGILLTDLRQLPANWQVQSPLLVSGAVVLATDYFRNFVFAWIKLFGGRIGVYEELMQRARREAVVRMLRQAQDHGANAVWNVRFESVTLQGQKKAAGIEVLAYGTALFVR